MRLSHRNSSQIIFAAAFAITLGLPGLTIAQNKKQTADLRAPEPGYLYPPGGRAGTTSDVQLGGYDWTPDLQFFVLDSRIKLQTSGEPGPILIPPPPYWFGAKAYITPLPLPREIPAKLTIPEGFPAGPVYWAVAGASGVCQKTGIFWVGTEPEVVEDSTSKVGQKLPALPVTVNGRLSRIEEVDRYRFTAAKDGPVTCEVFARRLGVNMNVALAVRDAHGQLVVDGIDTEGQDLALTFWAKAGVEYTLSINDFDFRGDRSFVYRLTLTAGPRVLATLPALGKRGGIQEIEFLGLGLATGQPKLESIKQKVTFPEDPKQNFLTHRLETKFGTTPAFGIPLSSISQSVASKASNEILHVPASITGIFEGASTEARFRCEGKKGEVWNLAAEARRFGSPLDLVLSILGPDGKQVSQNDDLPGTTDAGLTLQLPADGMYTLVVSDQSGKVGKKTSLYRLLVEKVIPDFAVTTVARLNLQIGGTGEFLVKANRIGGFKEPISLRITGLPEGVTVPANLVIPPDKSELKIALTAADNAPAMASLVTITGTAATISHVAFASLSGNLAAKYPDEERTSSLLMATTLVPRLKLIDVEADGGRKVHRGSTHPAEVILERINDFKGEVSLQMNSIQSYQRQGINGPDMIVPASENRAFYPCFMPEWLETTRTSRMELIGVVKVPDAKGKIRYLVTPMLGRITMSIEGAILKVDPGLREIALRPGESVQIPVKVLRSAKLPVPVKLELKLPEELAGVLKAEAVTVPPGQTSVNMRITCTKEVNSNEMPAIIIRGTALQDGRYAVVSEGNINFECLKKK
ncbi:hypothetical protein KIH39_22575 [Telmatocola sphagniphila]|uniref:Peptidase C-terminal archaeal/bacterial domain-containing protein n=1 Tax=Telmatocola sphagniphila TaxID=1123043 RepID=A0A8E6B5E7_9BACT|nr:hypothetical protein [Telmatocola sphagniphila]QVL31599.1 hypothetical protein KIH39_22575 [Telmatocola sphagniphila]